AYDNSSVASGGSGGGIQLQTGTGNTTVKKAGTAYGFSTLSGVNTGYLNVLRDPNQPFVGSTPLYFTNVSNINNKGWGSRISAYSPGEVETDIHRIITWVDQAMI